MKCSVVYEGVPRLQEHERRSGHNPPPLLGIEEHDDEHNASDDEPVNVDEVPNPRNTNCVPVARRADDRRKITGIVFRRPDAVAGNLERRKPDPFASRRAVIIEIQTGMIHQDGQTAANQHHHKKEIEEVAVADPERKPVRPGEVVGIYLGNGWNMRQACHGKLNPGTREPPREPPQRFRSEWKGESRCGSGGPLGSALPDARHRKKSYPPLRTRR